VLHDGSEVVCVVGHDVTERKRAEEEIRESQRALATLMSNLPGMAYRCRNDPDWTMELVSAGCSELTGYPPGDLIGNRQKSYGDLIHPDDREAVWQSVQAALRERRPFQFNYRITTASEAMKWVWEQGRGVFSPEGTLLALEGFITDITESKRVRDALVQSEARYRAVIEQATEGIFLCDATTGEVIESNSAFQELLGYTAGELRGIRIHDLIDDDRESIDSNLRLILDEGSRFLGGRRYRRKDGSLVDVEAAASVIAYGGRKVICDVIATSPSASRPSGCLKSALRP
jgi:PAS domain S-box-containing protein